MTWKSLPCPKSIFPSNVLLVVRSVGRYVPSWIDAYSWWTELVAYPVSFCPLLLLPAPQATSLRTLIPLSSGIDPNWSKCSLISLAKGWFRNGHYPIQGHKMWEVFCRWASEKISSINQRGKEGEEEGREERDITSLLLQTLLTFDMTLSA